MKKTISKGFSLLELMIVIAIIGIISSIAYPSYQDYVLRSHRVEARALLQQAAQKLQQNYSIHRRYDQIGSSTVPINDAMLATWGLAVSPAGATGAKVRYEISFVGGQPGAQEYTLQAVPQGVQADDKCGTFNLSDKGAKTVNSQTARDQISIDCWRG